MGDPWATIKQIMGDPRPSTSPSPGWVSKGTPAGVPCESHGRSIRQHQTLMEPPTAPSFPGWESHRGPMRYPREGYESPMGNPWAATKNLSPPPWVLSLHRCLGWCSFNPIDDFLADPQCHDGECPTCAEGCSYDNSYHNAFLFHLETDPYEKARRSTLNILDNM